MSRPPSGPPRRGPAVVARRLTALTAAALLGALCAPAPLAAASPAASASPSTSASPTLPGGLYGTSDPTYDGVFRQATALLALSAVKVAPAGSAVDWLTGQICPDGGFEAYRADPSAACSTRHEDTNSTGMAVQALSRLGGHHGVVSRAVAWLERQQNRDGGWGYQAGAASDADSTAVVAGALRTAGVATEPTRAGHGPQDALRALQLGCSAKAARRGAFAYQSDPASGRLTPNAKATTDGVLGALDSGYLVAAPRADRPTAPLPCSSHSAGASGPAGSAAAGSAYLAAALASGGQHLTTAQPGSSRKTPDFGTTADAVLALAADGHRTAALKPYTWLERHGADAWAKGSPAALGSLILASGAVGADPHAFGGADLVAQLVALGPEPAAARPPAAHASTGHGGGISPWWLIGVGLLAGIGVGLAYRLRARPGGRGAGDPRDAAPEGGDAPREPTPDGSGDVGRADPDGNGEQDRGPQDVGPGPRS